MENDNLKKETPDEVKPRVIRSFIDEKCTFEFKYMFHGVCLRSCCFNEKCSVTNQRCVAWE